MPASNSALESVRISVEVADAQVVVLGAGAADAADDPVALGVLVGAAQHHRRRAGAERQRGELRQRSSAVVSSPASRSSVASWVQRGALAVDEQRVVDLAGVDHRAGQLDAVDEAEAGVGDVEVQAAGRQAELVVDGDGRAPARGGPADRGVDQQADLARVDAGLGQRLRAGHRRRVDERDVLGPPAALAHAGQLLDHARLACPTRSYVSLSRASNSADVTTTGASTAHTDSTAVLWCRKLALPLIAVPSRVSGSRLRIPPVRCASPW